jgi:hypothetical protein
MNLQLNGHLISIVTHPNAGELNILSGDDDKKGYSAEINIPVLVITKPGCFPLWRRCASNVFIAMHSFFMPQLYYKNKKIVLVIDKILNNKMKYLVASLVNWKASG